MRKLTPEERAAKKAQTGAAPAEHTHTADCGHEVAEDKPKRKKKSADEAPAEEAVTEATAEEAPAVADTPAEEAPAEESAPAE